MIQGILAWAILPVLMLGIAVAWLAKLSDFHVGSVAAAVEMSQTEFEKHVRAYLLEHPEVIGEALNRLEAKQGELDDGKDHQAWRDTPHLRNAGIRGRRSGHDRCA